MKFRLARETAFTVVLVSSSLFVLPCTAQTPADNYPANGDSKSKPQSSNKNASGTYTPQSQGDNYPASKDAASQTKFSDSHSAGSYTPQSQEDSNNARKDYADHVRESYNYHFGQGDISTPGNAKVAGDDFIQPGAFPTAKYCSKCHQEAYSQWRQALHSNSFRTPFYRTSVNILLRTKGIEFTRHCDSCHNPIGVLSGALTQDSQVDRSFDEEGLTCTTCHSVQKLQPTVGNGGFVLGVPAVTSDENGNRIPGQVPYEMIFDHPERHAKTVMKDFYRTPEFCSACHKANLPTPLNDYKFVRAFTVFDEWQNSKFSKRNPLTFYTADLTTCQNCHMKRSAPALFEVGQKNGTFASHRWTAGNTAVPFYYGFDEQLQKTIDFLKSGTFLNVDLFAIKKVDPWAAETKAYTDGLIAPLGSVPFQLKRNDTVEAMVVIQNKNIGHSLIPEVRDLYEAYVEFEVKDSYGAEIYHSGFIQPDGSLDPRAHSFTNRPVNTDGEFVDNHKVWTIHSVAYDSTVPAGRSVLVRYRFHIPSNAKGPLNVTARVNYRHLRQSYLNNVFGKDHPAYPIIEISERSRILKLGENPATPPSPQNMASATPASQSPASVTPASQTPAPQQAAGPVVSQDNPEWMRWNNFGIACLDQQQYADAVIAFAQVVKLRPDYADGYTNIALTNILWEKYGSARGSLERALALGPDNARALYYMALVERRTGNSEAEVADLEKVVAQYPKSSDARRELGKSYYRLNRLQDAQAQFETLQIIEPDDVAAHYNLSLIYARLGMDDKASEQATLFADKKADPNSPTYSLEFLRDHPEISTESVPWHMHKDLSLDLAGIPSKPSSIGAGKQ
jgi:Flp pilus assembly protein TadD